MNFFVFFIALVFGIGSSAFVCSKSNLPVKIRYKLDINSRNKVLIINIIVLILLCFVYSMNDNTDNFIIKIFSLILFFILVFIYYMIKDIKIMIIKEEEEERKKNKYKYENNFCYFCGYELENGEKVCPKCGKEIEDIGTVHK